MKKKIVDKRKRALRRKREERKDAILGSIYAALIALILFLIANHVY